MWVRQRTGDFADTVEILRLRQRTRDLARTRQAVRLWQCTCDVADTRQILRLRPGGGKVVHSGTGSRDGVSEAGVGQRGSGGVEVVPDVGGEVHGLLLL